MKFLLTLFFGTLIFLNIADGQSVQLNPIGAPEGAFISDYEINDSGQILAFQTGKGFFFSTDAGVNWNTVSSSDTLPGGRRIALHPDGTFYIYFQKFIKKLNPNTLNIEPVFESDHSISNLVIDENGTIFRSEVGAGTITFYKSENQGIDWDFVHTSLTNGYTYNHLFAPKGQDFIYVNLFEKDFGTGLFKIKKSGGGLSSESKILDLFAANICADIDGDIWVSTGSTLDFSDDGGNNFKRLISSDRNRASLNNFTCLENGNLILRSENSYVFGAQGFYKSSDKGQNWELLASTNYEKAGSINKMRYLSSSKRFYADFKNAGAFNFFNSDSTFLNWRSMIPDSSGSVSTALLFDSSGNMFIQNYSQWYRFNGQNTEKISINGEMGIKLLTITETDKLLAVAQNDSLFRSTDNGETWESFQNVPFYTRSDNRSFLKSENGVVFYYQHGMNQYYPLHISRDEGLTWRLIAAELFNESDIQVTSSGEIYGLLEQVQGYYLKKHFCKWEETDNTWDTLYTDPFVLRCFKDKTDRFILSGYRNGLQTSIFYNNDNFNFQRGNEFIKGSLISAKNGFILTLRNDRQIYITKNLGLSWELLYESQHPEQRITSFEIDDDNYLWVGFEGDYVHKSDRLLFDDNYIVGNVWSDFNLNCLYDSTEKYLPNVIVTAVGQDTFFANTRYDGYFSIPVPAGSYNVSVALADSLWQPCNSPMTVSLSGTYDTVFVDFPVKPRMYCPQLKVDLTIPQYRRCFQNSGYVYYCNNGTIAADSAYIQIVLDPRLQIDNASLPYSNPTLGNYFFDIGKMDVFDCGSLWFSTSHECDSLILGETICAEAYIFPDSICAPSSANWSGASLEIEGTCDGDSIRLKIKNTGTGAMTQSQNYIIIEDVAIMRTGPFLLPAGGELPLEAIEATGQTLHIETEQVAGHPGNSRPSLTVEGCGELPHNLGLFNQFGQNDDDPFIDIECREVVGSYDPNDKAAVPVGLDVEHKIQPGRTIEYLIRFQNTGTDTAFTVNIIDTLSHWLDVTSFEAGASSHNYDYEISGQGTVRFKFNNILLPDSTTNEPASNGFIKYKIAMKTDIPLGAEIFNDADIYFDYNDPIRTNETFHVVDEPWVLVKTGEVFLPKSEVKVYPNPFSESAILELISEDLKTEFTCRIFDLNGRLVFVQSSDNQKVRLERSGLNEGIYFYEISGGGSKIAAGKLIVN